MKTYAVHQAVHYEGRAGHIARVLHYRYEEIEYQYVGQEDKHASHAGYDAVHDKVPQPAVPHQGAHGVPEPGHQGINPVHRILSDGESGLEYHEQYEDEYREGEPFVGDNGIDAVRERTARMMIDMAAQSLGEGALDEGVFRIDYG